MSSTYLQVPQKHPSIPEEVSKEEYAKRYGFSVRAARLLHFENEVVVVTTHCGPVTSLTKMHKEWSESKDKT